MRKTAIILFGASIIFLAYALQAELTDNPITILGFIGFLVAGYLYQLWTPRK
ncbi:MAG TPA: hypothetical protein VGE31_02825 [Candidatus Paceibacterota bacterium]